MKQKFQEKIEIPAGVNCEYAQKTLFCKKDAITLSRAVNIPYITLKLEGNAIILTALDANKNQKKIIYSYIKHIQNMFKGLSDKFVYKLEACNVHFPMTLKVEGNRLAINNFLGEKTPRYAEILPDVEVQIKGQFITISSHDKEAAGQTAGNFEKATRVSNRDRRIFQDGIYIAEKPGEEK